MKKFHAYFSTHKAVTLALMWAFFAVTLGYMLLCLLAFPQWPFWLCLAPGLVCLYLRLTYAKAAYDPARDKFSERYVPRPPAPNR